jgi:SAM-dependent methyltransferase
MLPEEARWLGRHLGTLNGDDISPMCNIGSASEEFRTVYQPYIESEIFAPLRRRGIQVLHVDARMDHGVDLVGDLTDETFLERLTARKFNAVMCCNLLEHVTDRPLVRDAIMSMLRPGGLIIISVPNLFPYHEDPIDTMFRPGVADLRALFPGALFVSGSIVRASRFQNDMGGDLAALGWLLVRCCVPFYRPRRWLAAMRRVRGLIVGYKVACAILRVAPDQRRATI